MLTPQPPLRLASYNRWSQWHKVFKFDYGHEEASAIFGRDPRSYGVMIKLFEGDNLGRVQEVHTIEFEWVASGSGRTTLKEILGNERCFIAIQEISCPLISHS